MLKHYFLAIWLQLMYKCHFKFQSQVIFEQLFSVSGIFEVPSAKLLGILYQVILKLSNNEMCVLLSSTSENKGTH